MTVDLTYTEFAPAERADDRQIRHENEIFAKIPLIQMLLDMMPCQVLILNQQRQIVFANQAIRNILASRETPFLGQRPGEALDCVRAPLNPAGCGTSQFCEVCGAVRAVLNCQQGQADTQECRISRTNNDALDLRVWAMPFDYEDTQFTVFSIVDKSDENRRKVLERIFFHDVLNTASSLYGYADVLNESLAGHEMGPYANTVFRLTAGIIDEIEAQRELVRAEHNELAATLVTVDSVDAITEVADAYRSHKVAQGKTVTVAGDSHSVEFDTDTTLLKRVIGNMTKNALEASPEGNTVTLSCYLKDDSIEFRVHNAGVMSRDVSLQVFSRSFSTKGAGRGLGTYSIKLLSERYLKGTVSFTSTPEEGTTFYAAFPIA